MRTRFTVRLGDCLRSPHRKKDYNEKVFTEVAPRYDFITRALSFGRDAAWKREMVASLPAWESPVCCDLASGTGDIARLLAAKYPRGRIVALDLTQRMLQLAVGRNRFPNIRFVRQDMGELGVASAAADLVTGGYALRNAPDLAMTLREIHRVLKPGGVAAFLDFSKPCHRVAQRIEHRLLKLWGGFWGLLLHGNAEVYGYIAESLREFPDRVALRELLLRHGFTVAASRLRFFGVMEMVVAIKRDDAPGCGPRARQR